MARIETYTAQRALQPGNTPTARLSSAVGEELGALGGTLASVSATLAERQQRKEDFAAENGYRRLKLELENDMVNQQQTMPPDGSGFHEKFLVESYRPRRDAFLSTVPERLRPRFESLLNDTGGPDALEWSMRSATVERDTMYSWQRDEIKQTQDMLATAISLNPDGYDALLEDGRQLITAASLPRPERDKLLADWETTAQTAILNRMLETDPQGALRELGVDTRQLSPTTQFAILSRAVQWRESRDNPNAVSNKGAMGLMQIMPGTAADVAKALGDTQFPHGAPENIIRAYMSNPYINKMYGEHYLQQQLRRFANTRNPVETALVAYNWGPENAQRWVESGYDDSMLPKETRDYKTEIMASISAPGSKGDPATVKFAGNNGATLEGVNTDLQARLQDAFAAVGLDTIRFNSGHRSPFENRKAGGAENSQHLHGNALDIDVTNMKITERVELVKALSAAGVTGLGIGSNIIHADLGGRRAWGYATAAGGGEVPKWAQGVIAEHLAGTTPPVRRVAGRYGSLPYDKRQQFTTKADQLIAQQQAQRARSTAVEKVQVRMSRDNELASIRATGQSTPNFDETAISTILGEDDYLKFVDDRATAQAVFTAKQGISQMTPADMDARYEEYAPLAGSADFARQQEVQAAVQREIDRVRRLRASRPDKAALEFPEVKGTYEGLSEQLAQGDPTPTDVQGFVKLMLDTQAGIEIAEDARAPVPREWAVEIGKALSRVPEATGRNTRDVQASILAQFTALQTTFGDYADEVISYALSEYNGINKEQAKLLSGYVTALEAGSGIFRTKAIDQMQDTSQVEGFNLFDFFFPPSDTDAATAEERLRQEAAEEP